MKLPLVITSLFILIDTTIFFSNDNCINAVAKLVIVQFRPIVTICPNWTMANFQTRKFKYHIMSRTILLMFNGSMWCNKFLSLLYQWNFLKWYKNVIVKNRITIVRYPASIVTIESLFKSVLFRSEGLWSVQIKMVFQCFWSKWLEEDLNHRSLVSKVITITTRPFDHVFGYGKESTFI